MPLQRVFEWLAQALVDVMSYNVEKGNNIIKTVWYFTSTSWGNRGSQGAEGTAALGDLFCHCSLRLQTAQSVNYSWPRN